MKSVLKRVVKVEFTRYGEERSVEEERRVDGELGSAVDGYMFLMRATRQEIVQRQKRRRRVALLMLLGSKSFILVIRRR